MPSALQRKIGRHNPLCAASRLGIQAMASPLKASRAEFSHQYFLVAAKTCLQIFRFVIGALRSVSSQTSFNDSRDYRTRCTGAPQNTGGGRCFPNFRRAANYKAHLGPNPWAQFNATNIDQWDCPVGQIGPSLGPLLWNWAYN